MRYTELESVWVETISGSRILRLEGGNIRDGMGMGAMVLSGTGKGLDGQTILLLPIMDSHANWRVMSSDLYDYLKWPTAWDRFCNEVGNSGWRAG